MLDGQVTPKLLQDQLSMIAQQQQLLQSLQHQQLQLQAAQQHHTQQMQLMQQGALHATSAPLSVGPQSSAAPQPAAGTANGSGPIISEQLATLALTQGGDPALPLLPQLPGSSAAAPAASAPYTTTGFSL